MIGVLLSILIVTFYWLGTFKKSNVFQHIMLGFYLGVSFGAIGCIGYKVYPWYVNPINILVFTILYLYCVWSFNSVKLDMKRVIYYQNKIGIGWFYYIYLLVCVIFFFVFIPKCIETLSTGSFLLAYEELRESGIDRFDSSAQKWLYYFVSRLQYPALIIGFNYLCTNRVKRGVIIIFAAVSSIFVWAIYVVSRTDIFQLVVIVFILYILYKNYIPHKVLRGINVGLTVIASIVITGFILITLSRTEYKTDNLWIFDYFGRSLLTFNSVMEHPAVIKDGTYFWGTQTHFSIGHPSYGGHEFVSLFARMYMDFDWLGFVPFLFMPLLLPRKRIALPELYLLLWIFNTLLIGVMYSTFTFTEIVFALLIFSMLKIYFSSPSKTWLSIIRNRNLTINRV